MPIENNTKENTYYQAVRQQVAPFSLRDGIVKWDSDTKEYKKTARLAAGSSVEFEIGCYPFCYGLDESGNTLRLADNDLNDIPDIFDVMLRSNHPDRRLRKSFSPTEYKTGTAIDFNAVDAAFDAAVTFAVGLKIAYDISYGGLERASLAAKVAKMVIDTPSHELLQQLEHNGNKGFYATTRALIPTVLNKEYLALVQREKSMELIPVSADSVRDKDVFVGQTSWFECVPAETVLKSTPHLSVYTNDKDNKKARNRP